MSIWYKLRTPGIWLSGLATGLFIGVGMMIGAVVVTHHRVSEIEAPIRLPAELQAVASSGASTFAIATGQISDSEGIFFLDFLTGDLTCAVLYKNGLWGAKFVANVFLDLDAAEGSKKPHFLMVTGQNTFARGAGGGQPGRSVVYVVDSTTGSFAVYAVPWNRQLEATLTPQGGNLVMLQKGRARNLQIRDQ